MKKKDIVDRLCAGKRLPRAVAEKAVEDVISVVRGALCTGDDVVLRGLGTFSVREIKAHRVHDFSTGDTMDVPAHKIVKFKLAKSIKEALNQRNK